MLQEGHRLKAEGIDVVIGLLETHGRAGIARLAQGLEVVPRRAQDYHGIAVEEMDVDAILARKPQVALIDELAHTNVPGSRNAKRYEDVQDILAAGIHVITTLNVQHLESLYNVVENAVGVKVRERHPGFDPGRSGPDRRRRPGHRGPPEAPRGGQDLPGRTHRDGPGQLLHAVQPGEAPRAHPPRAGLADRPAAARGAGRGRRRPRRTRSWSA